MISVFSLHDKSIIVALFWIVENMKHSVVWFYTKLTYGCTVDHGIGCPGLGLDTADLINIPAVTRWQPPGVTWSYESTFFKHRVVHQWNKLSENIANTSTVNTLKNHLDQPWATTVYAELLA